MYLLPAFALPFLTGCSTFVAVSGQDLSNLTTRAQVHDTFGPPAVVEQVSGETTEEFATRRKIAEPHKSIYLTMGYVITLGLGELVWFPHECYVAARRSTVGQRLQFTYDDGGRVVGIRHDGNAVTVRPHP